VKQIITRIRNTDRRRLAITAFLVATFGGLNWALSKLAGLVIASNPHNYGVGDAATSGYLLGFAASFAVMSWMKRAAKALDDRFGKQTSAAAE